MNQTFQQLDRLRNTEPRVVMATVVSTHGSTLRKGTARSFLGSGGRVLTPGMAGHALEARLAADADAVLAANRSRVVPVTLPEHEAWEIGLTGAATVDVLLEPISFGVSDPVAEAWDRAREEIGGGRPVVMVVPLDGRRGRLVVYDSGNSAGSLGDPATDEVARVHAVPVVAAGESHVARLEVDCAEVPVYVERLAPAPTLIVYGASPVCEALIGLAKRFGMHTVVVEGRERFARRQPLEAADEVLSATAAGTAERLPAGPQTAIVLASHDPRHEVPTLRRLLARGIGYAAVLGARRKGSGVLELLREAGVPEDQVAAIRTPGGFESASQGGAELALAIVAEIVKVQRLRGGAGPRPTPG